MVITKIKEIVSKTSDISNYPPEIVEQVMNHVFLSWKDYLMNPTSPGLRLPHLGVIRPSYRALNHYILSVFMKKLRADHQNEELRERFRKYWALRGIIRKDEQRRDYITKYGSWHYK